MHLRLKFIFLTVTVAGGAYKKTQMPLSETVTEIQTSRNVLQELNSYQKSNRGDQLI